MASESNWSSFLNFIEDLLNECENQMSGEDYSKIEGLLERLHAARNGCERIVHALTSLSEIELDSETVSKIKVFSGTLQGVIDCAENKLYMINPSVYASSRIPEVLVHRSGFVGRPWVVLNLVQVQLLRSWRFSWTRIAYTLCISRTTLWRLLKEAGYDFSIDGRFTQISDDSLIKEIERIKETFPDCGERMVIGCLRSNGIHVARHRVRGIIRVQDPIAVLLRWTIATTRRKYSVPGPNAL